MTKEEIAQWVINNRYPKSEKEKVSDSEMYHKLVDEISKIPMPFFIISECDCGFTWSNEAGTVCNLHCAVKKEDVKK